VDPSPQEDRSHSAKEMITANFPEKRLRGNPDDDDQSSAKHLRGRNPPNKEGSTTLNAINNMDHSQTASSSSSDRLNISDHLQETATAACEGNNRVMQYANHESERIRERQFLDLPREENRIKPSFQAAKRAQNLKSNRISAVGNDTRATQHPGIPVNNTSDQVAAKCPRVVDKLNESVYNQTVARVSGRPPGIEKVD